MVEFCLGSAQIGMDYGIANKAGMPTKQKSSEIIKYAIDNDIRYIDTAQSYGESETILGDSTQNIQNKKLIRFISKLSPEVDPLNEELIIESVFTSLSNLNIESLYGFLAHQPETFKHESFVSAINYLKKNNKIIKSGVSVYTPKEALDALESPIIDILQIPMNILDRRWIDQKIIEKAQEKNIQLFFRSIFLQGLIFLDNTALKKRNMIWSKQYLEKFYKLASKTNLSIIELTFSILSHIKGKNIIILGVDSLNQLKDNINFIRNLNPNNVIVKKWWFDLPEFPERLLNPKLWN